LGIVPAEIVVHRNAMYCLWHLRRRAWFKQYLPDLAHLQPIQRLTSVVLQYSSLKLCDIDRLEYDQWQLAAKHAVLKRAQTFYQTDDRDDYYLYPRKTYNFKYLAPYPRA